MGIQMSILAKHNFAKRFACLIIVVSTLACSASAYDQGIDHFEKREDQPIRQEISKCLVL